MQKLRQFEFLTLAIKISFLYDFCTDVLLIEQNFFAVYMKFFIDQTFSVKMAGN